MSHGSWAHAVTLELSNESALSLQAASTETTVLQQRPAVLGVGLSNESALSLQAASTETTVLQQRPAVLGVGLHCPESYLVTIAIYGHCQAASAETTVLQQRPAVLGVIPEWATLPGVIPGVYHHNNLSLSYHNIPPNKSQTKDNIKVSVLYGNFFAHQKFTVLNEARRYVSYFMVAF